MENIKIDEVVESLKSIKELQNIVDEMKSMPAFRKYIKAKNLSLLDNKFKLIDDLLKKGLLK